MRTFFTQLPSRTIPSCLGGLLLWSLLVAPSGAWGQDLEGLGTGATHDLRQSLAELATVRQQVEAERLPLAKKLTELEQMLAERKAALAKAQRFQENQLVELNALKGEARQRSEEVKYVEALLGEYARAFRSRLNFIEEPRYRALFESLEKAAATPDLAPADRFTQRAALLTTALKRAENALGGEIFEGQALDKNGRVRQGKAALIGPVALFASTSGEIAGLLQQELNKADPTVTSIDPKVDQSLRQLLTTRTGEFALDATLGNAFKLAAMKESLYEKLAAGGLIMIPLLGLGALALIIAAAKWMQLARIRLATEEDLQRVLRHLENREPEKARAHARGIPGLAGILLATAVDHADQKKEYLEEVLYEKMLGARAQLERGLAFLALSATTGPLLGLLGTVIGMIATFQMISSVGSGDPKALAAGISEALICTATGMSVAIPSLLFHAFLSRKAKGIIGGMEQISVGFVNGMPGEEKPAFDA